MTEFNSRLAAIRDLLDDKEGRYVRERWETIFADQGLSPQTKSDIFQKDFYDLLITEMEEGYQRKDKARREKRQRTGKSGGYIPPQMRINGTIGRFLFAYFQWHAPAGIPADSGIETKGLMDIAEAFGFKMDPIENKRQFMKAEERQNVIDKEENIRYYGWLFKIMIVGLIGSIILILKYLF